MGVQGMEMTLQNQWRTWVQSQLSQWDLPSQEMFDVQTRVLESTRLKLQRLEERLKKLESTLSSTQMGGVDP